MAKSTKHKDAVKSFDDFRAPWETADGSEAEIDKPKLKRYIYGLVTDKANAQDAREDALADVETLTAELDEAKKQAESANGEEASKKIAKLEKDLEKANSRVTELETSIEQAELRKEVLGDLPDRYAKYVTGETREELEKSLEEVKADFGLDTDEGGDEGDDEDEPQVRTRPRTNLRNPLDEKSGKAGAESIDFDQVAEDILGSSVFR